MTKVSVTRVAGETNERESHVMNPYLNSTETDERESHVMNPYLNSTLTLAETLHGAINSLTDRITKPEFESFDDNGGVHEEQDYFNHSFML